ncbi:MAG: hypothetical protein A3J06_00485 [Candidatus Moranbacteria bacterium RIFCSPLOWO2_02_FULL_48_19]|nr:MAG: hypothetical protein A3J06_00485 [Candidatus Moranbacteria bacterium RIFCSPLOWO2_02_FULL_48_19]
MLFASPVAIPKEWQSRYRILRAILCAAVILFVIIFALRALFPTLVFSFNFKTPSSSKNKLLDPRSPDTTPRTNGKIEAGGTLVTDVGVIGDLSQAAATLTLEKKSALPDTLAFSLRRSYRSFFLPTGSPITSFPKESLYRIDATYYALRSGTLYPFVSDNAYLSRYPDTFAQPENKDFLTRYPVSEKWIGFRVGSVVSFADGVFLIASDTEMRPVGSADIFLSLGYRFEDVRPVSEEELGIYKRGRIFLLGSRHPDGTLLLDRDTATYYLVDGGFKRPLLDAPYRDFIAKQQAPISVSSQASEQHADCTLLPGLFGQTFACTTPLDALSAQSGPDFEISISQGNTDIDINTLQVSFDTKKSTKNMLFLLSQIKERILSRFGVNR